MTGYCIDPCLPLTAEVRRIAAGQLEEALGRLAAVRGNPDEAFHECRKRLKNVRALLRLVRPGDKEFARIENARYREAAASLAGPREAGALIETVDRLATAYPEHARPLAAVRKRLLARRRSALSGDLEETVRAAAEACQAGMGRLDSLVLPGGEEAAEVLVRGARRTLRQAHDALHGAKAHGRAADFHELRKAIKAHVTQLSLLRDFWPARAKAGRKAFTTLAEQLGELHDLVVLRQVLRAGRASPAATAAAGEVRRLCKRVEQELEKACLRQASTLLKDDAGLSAGRFARKARREFVRAQSPAASGQPAGNRRPGRATGSG